MATQKLYDWSGSEYAVGTTTDGDETMPRMAWVSATSYVVVWTASGVQPEIRAQLFDASGTKIGDEFAIGADHGGATNAVVAQLAGGGFVVAWVDTDSGPNNESPLIRFQRFDSTGAAVGAEGAAEAMDGLPHHPAIAGLAGGGFVITWTDSGPGGPDTSLFAVYGQVFDSAGAPAGAAFTVNTITEQSQQASSVAALPGGGFAVVWQDGSPQGVAGPTTRPDYGTDIAIQIFDAAGNKLGPQRVVDEMTPLVTFSFNPEGRVTATAPVVTALADGRLAVAWGDFDGLIKTRILAADGTPLTAVAISGEVSSQLASRSITALSDGGYAVSWTTETKGPPDSSGTSVHVAVYDSTGARQGDEFVANQIVDGAQGGAAILGTPGGGFAMVWQDSSSLSDGIDLRGRHFAPDAGEITDIAFSGAISQTAVENIMVGRLSAEGALNGVFTYQILSDSSGAFRIEGDRLVVADTFLLATHDADSVILQLRVTDTNGNSWEEFLDLPIDRPAAGTLYVADDQFVVVPYFPDQPSVQSPDLLTLAGGRVLLTWNGPGSTLGVDIVGQLFEADGTPVTAPFTLNTLVNGLDLEHDLAALPNGGFVATWTSSIGDGSNNFGVRAQLFDADGAKVGAELAVNTTTQNQQSQPSVTALAGGGFFIAWFDSNNPFPNPLADAGEIKGQYFTAAGAKVGGELHINSVTTGQQIAPTVAELASGKIVVAWTDFSATDGDSSAGAVRATLLNADGSVAVAEFRVNSTTLQHQHVSTATALAGGGFVIVWRDTSENPVFTTNQFSPADIRGQLYDADGQAVGGEFLINQDTYGAQAEPLVVAGPDGGFVVTWSSWSHFGGDDHLTSVMARSFAADGTPEGNAFLVNQIGQGQQGIPAVTWLDSGDLVFAWWDIQNRLENGVGVPEISARVLQAVADVANGSADGDVIQGGDRIDIIDGDGGDDTIGGGGNDDLLRGGDGIDALSGEAGDDLLDGGLGADAMAGGLGDDLFLVDDAGDTISEAVGEGLDEVFTNLAAFSIAGFANVEALTGGAGDQSLTGNGGDNRIDGGGGADALAGGGGNDVYIVDNPGDTVTELAGEGTDEIRTGLGSKAPPDRLVYVLPDFVENLTGTSAGAQGVRDNAQDNVIIMGNGHDLIVADGGGIDTVSGGGGNDFIYHGDKLTAADITNGGAGVDTISLLGDYGSGIIFTATNLVGVERMALYTSLYLPGTGPNNYTITMHDANVAAGTEFFVTAASLQANEVLTFNGGAETNGRFTIHGGGGADTIIGGTGNDFFIGNAGNDTLYGLGGNDALTGGLGADQLRGGAGADYFRYLSVAQSTTGSVDRILDFQHIDRIDLSTIDANGNAGDGNNAFTFIGANAFGNVAGQLRAYQSGADWFVEGDVNGDGLADLIIQVTLPDATALGAGDFIL